MEFRFVVKRFLCYDAGFSFKRDLDETKVFSDFASALRYIADFSSHFGCCLDIRYDSLTGVICVYFAP